MNLRHVSLGFTLLAKCRFMTGQISVAAASVIIKVQIELYFRAGAAPNVKRGAVFD